MAVDVSGVEKRKALDKGLQQLAQEGAVQLFTDMTTGVASPIMGAVGQLQFEVLVHRMQTEYKVKLKLAPLPYQVARWPQGDFDPDIFRFSETAKVVEDRDGRPVVLFKSLWNLDWVRQKYPDLELAETADMHLFAAGQAKTN
jgi:peptide chain release factor 3